MALTRPRYSNIVDSDFKQSVRTVTTEDITLAGGAPAVYDGISFSAGDGVLVAAQANTAQNGIYAVTIVGTGNDGTWTRRFDASDGNRLTSGTQVPIAGGSFVGQVYRLITPDPITIDVSSLTFIGATNAAAGGNAQVQFSYAGSLTGADKLLYTFGNGNVIVDSTTPSTSTTTGALVVAGGVGIGGNVNIGDKLIINSNQAAISGSLVTSDYFLIATDGTAPSASILSASPTASHRAVFKGTRARGTLVSPDVPVVNDQVLTVLGAIYDGSLTQGTAAIDFKVDGTVSSGVAPQRISFVTGATNAGSRTERLLVSSGGNIVITASTTTTSATTGALVVSGGVGIGGNLWVTGNIFASNLVSIGTTTLSVTDPMLYLTANTLTPYNYDIGFYSQFIGGSNNNYQHTGFVRDASDATWKLFSNVKSEPGATIDFTDAGLVWDRFSLGDVVIANTTPSISSTTGALTVAGGVGIAGDINIANNLNITGTGARIIGDFSNATQTNKVAFQTSTTDGATVVTALPNGSSTNAQLRAYNSSDPTNSAYVGIYANPDAMQLTSSITGTGTYIPLTIYTGGSEKLRIDTSGNVNIGGGATNYGGLVSIARTQTNQIANFLSLRDATNGAITNFSTYGDPTFGTGSRWDFGGAFLAIRNDSTERIRIDNVGNVVIQATTSSTSSTTGALILVGGAGIAGNLNVGGNIGHINLSAGTTASAPIEFTAGALKTTAGAGGVEYDGKVFYGTTQGSERGVIPVPQMYVNDANRLLAAATTYQDPFNKTFKVAANTRYYYELQLYVSKTNTTVNAFQYGLGITSATISSHTYMAMTKVAAARTTPTAVQSVSNRLTTGFGTSANISVSAAAAATFDARITGWIDVGAAGGTINPLIALTNVAPTAPTVLPQSHMMIYPVGPIGANTSVS